MITEKDMQYILTIANYGNLTKAADAVSITAGFKHSFEAAGKLSWSAAF